MNKPIINGIDVSECCFYNNGKCNNPNGMSCNCINNAVCYFKELKRLQKENKRLNQELDIKEKMLDKFMIGSGETLEKLQKENEELKEKIHFKNLYKLSGKCFFDAARQCNYFDDFVKARQALEKIRNEADRLLYEENPIYGYNNSNYFEILAKYVLAKTKEVLNDRN